MYTSQEEGINLKEINLESSQHEQDEILTNQETCGSY